MRDLIKSELLAKLALTLFSVLSIWWLTLFLTQPQQATNQNQLFAATYGIMAFLGGILGLNISSHWGGFKSLFGRAILVFSLGLLFQEFGQLAYTYYIYFLHVDVPYPSIGDIGYFGSIPLYAYGTWLLGKATGIKISLQTAKSKFQAIFIPIIMTLLSYALFLQNYEFDWSNPLIIFLDFGYPLGQAFYISLALLTYLLSRNILGGVMKKNILFILLALVVQFIADYTFLFQANREIWYAGGINDFIYLIGYFLMTLALIQSKQIYKSLKI